MGITIGSARHDEKNAYSGGMKGDKLQTSTPDYKGEVSMQPFYLHKKGWNVIRAKEPSMALKIAENMKKACNNKSLGYSQSDRYGVIKYGINTTIPTNCDCSSLVRACVKEASGKDPGDFTTANATGKLLSTGLFNDFFSYTPGTVLKTGDILCTRTKGHVVIVTDGNDPAEKNGNPYAEPTKIVRLNSKGNDVRWMQFQLNRFGYKLLVNGNATPEVIGALVDFQAKHGLEPDGICGKLTRSALKMT